MALIRGRRRAIALVAAWLIGLSISSAPAAAQQIVATVNDSPITDYDVEQRVRMHSVLGLPATSAIALEGLIEDRVKLIETRKYKIPAGEPQVVEGMGRVAALLQIPTATLSARLEAAGVSAQHVREHFGAQNAWLIYARSINRSLDVSERQVRTELSRRGASGGWEYDLRQIIFILPSNASEQTLRSRTREAEELRRRFTDCSTGPRLAARMHDVAVKETVTRSGETLDAGFVRLLDSMPIGRITAPRPTSTGLEMLALCGKRPSRDSEESAADEMRQSLLARRHEQEGDRLYSRVRARAVIVRR
jgi:peptidyl-prolyl cis-trans isomerase SurA